VSLTLPGIPCPPPFRAVVGAATCLARKRIGCRDCIHCAVGDQKITAEALRSTARLCSECSLVAEPISLSPSAAKRGMPALCKYHLRSWRQKHRAKFPKESQVRRSG